ncbi:EpsG family protein [Vibrio sp. 10N.247.311.59]|uniref:EpsG family protein n=1 Tax=Vibrio sp. 10N.247.311.59 TaxID=3229989 RepID=UPI00354F01C5
MIWLTSYLVLYLGVIFITALLPEKNKQIIFALNSIIFSIIVYATLTFGIANREIFGDSLNYYYYFEAVCNGRVGDYYSLFYYMNFMSCGMNYRIYFSLFPIIMASTYFLVCFDRYIIYNMAFLTILVVSGNIFLQYSGSGLKQCLSICFVLMALKSLLDERLVRVTIFSILAVNFHFSSLLFLLPVLLLNFWKRKISKEEIKLVLVISVISTLISIFKVNNIFEGMEILKTMSDGRYAIYGTGIESYPTGFRLSFFIYSMFPLIVFAVLKYGFRINMSHICYYLLVVYLLFYSVATILNSMPYSDRFYAYSWSITPVILYYCGSSILSDRKVSSFRFILYFVLITLLMAILFINYNSAFYLRLDNILA